MPINWHKVTIYFVLLLIFILYFLKQVLFMGFNYSASMPIGFYQSTSANVLHRGDIVAVCLPNLISTEGINRRYLRSGSCPNHTIPVLKQIIALLGDKVHLTDRSMIINGISYYAPNQKSDHNGQPVKKFIANGFYKSNGYWLYGSKDFIHSWDSRYYGPVSRENIIGIYRPILTF